MKRVLKVITARKKKEECSSGKAGACYPLIGKHAAAGVRDRCHYARILFLNEILLTHISPSIIADELSYATLRFLEFQHRYLIAI